MIKKKKILFIISEDWYFFSHRLSLAVIAIKSGYEVGLLCRVSKYRKEIEAEGVKVFNWSINRESKNIFKETVAILNIVSILHKFKPNLIHSVAMKPVLYSAIASSYVGHQKSIFALAGLGYIFTSRNNFAKIVRLFLIICFKKIFYNKNNKLVLQNPEDRSLLLDLNVISKNNVHLIRGAGVDTFSFFYKPIPFKNPIIMLPSRMLWAKGVQDFVDCAEIINDKKKIARFVLVGGPDTQNPDTISEYQLEKWNNSGVVEWWGNQDDMPSIIQQATIICLPTFYGEGLPKCLLEGASSGRPIVSYDVPGCREIVVNNYNGFLVKSRSIEGLVKSIIMLLADNDLCIQMGKNGRKLVKNNFTQEIVGKETIQLWEDLLKA